MLIDRNALNKMKQKTTAAGFTLVEVLVAAGITSVVLVGVGTGMVSMVRANARAEANSEQRMALNRAQDFITDEARSAQGMWQSGAKPGWWPTSTTSGTNPAEKLYLQVPLRNIVSIASNQINLPRHGFQDGDAVIFTGTTTGLGLTLSSPTAATSTATVYYVRESATDNFKVAATPGGTALTLTNSTTAVIVPSRLVTYFDRDSDASWLGPKAIHRSTGPCGTTDATRAAQCPMLVDAIDDTSGFTATVTSGTSGGRVALVLRGQLYADNSMIGGAGDSLSVDTDAKARPVLVAAGGGGGTGGGGATPSPSPSSSPSSSPSPSVSPSPSPSPSPYPYPSPSPSPTGNPSPSPTGNPSPSPSPSPYPSPSPSPTSNPSPSPSPSPTPRPSPSPAPSPSPSPTPRPSPSPSPSPTPTQTTNFTSTGGTVTVNRRSDISIQILGGDIRCSSTSSTTIPTTTTINLTPPGTNARTTSTTVPTTQQGLNFNNQQPGTAFTISAGYSGTCLGTRSVNSKNDPSFVRTLRNGDPAPNIPAYGGGGANGALSVDAFLRPYISNGKMNLGANQVIFLFELYTNTSGSTYDLQDTVILATITER
jgi:type II secretory pathway pseudopilin PulG